MLTTLQLQTDLPLTDWLYGTYTIYTDLHEPGDLYQLGEDATILVDNLGSYYTRYFNSIGCRLNVIMDLLGIGYLDDPRNIGYTRLQLDDFLRQVNCANFEEFVRYSVSVDKSTGYLDMSLYCLILYKFANPKKITWLEDTYMFDITEMNYTVEDLDTVIKDVFDIAKLADIDMQMKKVELL